MVDVADRGESVSESRDSVSVANEDVSSLHLKGAIGEVSPSPEVVEHLLETTVGPRDAIVAGDGPRDVRGEELLEGNARAAGVELVLRLVEVVEQADGSFPIHAWRRIFITELLTTPALRWR
jgi:hypothetical protein